MKQKLSKRQLREERAGYLFVIPNFIGILIFVALPILFSLMLGFTRWNPMLGLSDIKFTGMENFMRMSSDGRLKEALMNNFTYTFTYVPLSVCLALVIAVLLNRFVFLKVPLRLMCFMPYISAMVSVAYVWLILLNPQGGLVNSVLAGLGVKNLPGWFTKSNSALAGIIVMSVWHDTGYYMIIFLSALQGLPREVYESARVDGAGGLQSFFRITIPMMGSNILFVSILATMNSFKVFDQINVLTEGGPGYSTNVLVYCIYHYAFREQNIGYASAVAVLLFVIIILISVVQIKLKEKYTI
nr:sugar ABC transporter permease [uncultured Clostridium sp.]